MPASMGLFSRRKNSDDKVLRATLAPPQVDPYLYSNASSSASTLSSSQHSSAIPQPPHSAPLLAYKEGLPKPPIVSGFATGSAGLVFAPHLTRTRTAAFDDPSTTRDNMQVKSRKPLNRSNTSGPDIRAKLFDQRPSMDGYQEYNQVPPLDGLRCQSSSPAMQHHSTVHPGAPASINYSRSVTPRTRAPLSTTGMNQNQNQLGFYSPVSSCSVYPASPPLSPESPLLNPVIGYGGNIERSDSNPRMGYDPEQAELENSILPRIHEPSASNSENGSEIYSHFNGLGDIPITEAEFATQAQSREQAALKREAQRLESPHGSNREDLESTPQSRRREHELVDAVKGKERELEFLRSSNHGYREQVAAMEQILAQKDEELENARVRIHEMGRNQPRNRNTPMVMEGLSETGLADMGRKLMEEIRRRERAEKLLAETILKAKADLNAVMADEEKKRAEVRAAVRMEYEQTRDHEQWLRDEAQRKSEENLQSIISEEERRRAELNWLFGEKIENIERQRKNDLEEFRKNLAGLKEEKERLENQVRDNVQDIERNQRSICAQREANEELLEMTKTINTRLGEEKKRNRQLEEKINQITEDALNSVSTANREVVMLKNVIEDKDTKIKFLETELAATTKDKKGMEEAWAGIETELEEARSALLGRDEKIKGLEVENTGVADRLEAYQKELDEFKQKVVAGEQQTKNPEIEEMVKIMELMKEDIELYRKDVKVYKRDVKKRDNQIKDLRRSVAELESLLESKTLETKVLQGALETPGSFGKGWRSSTDSSGSESTSPLHDEIAVLKQKIQSYGEEYRAMYEDHEALKKKHELFAAQQVLVITEIDKQLSQARKEKKAVEVAATRQLKKMQQGFLQLSQTAAAGHLAGIGGAAVIKKYQEVPLPPIPAGLEAVPSGPMRSNSSLKRTGSKMKGGRRYSSLPAEKLKVDIPPAAEPTVKMGATVRVVDEELDFRERAKLEKTMDVVYEPDGALGREAVVDEEEEEVIVW